MLHLITEPAWEESLLHRFGCDDKVLFLNAALLSVLSGGRREVGLQKLLSAADLFVLSDHLHVYGISPEYLLAGIAVIDYAQFVALSIEEDSVQTWS